MKTTISTKAGLLATLLGLTALLMPADAGARTPQLPSLSDITGSAEVRAHVHGEWRAATPDQVLDVAQYLRCANGCALRVGGATVRLAVETTVRSMGRQFYRLPGRELAVPCQTFQLLAGGVDVDLAKEGRAPIAIAFDDSHQLVVGSGTAEVRNGPRGPAAVVHGGKAYRRVGKRWHDVAGSGLVVLEKDGPSRRLGRLPAPTWRTGDKDHRPVGLAADQPEATVSLAWEGPESATGYRLQVSDSDEFDRILVGRQLAVGESHIELTLREGRYFARLQAAGPYGFWSESTSALPLQVVRVALPDGGALTADGTLVLPPDSTLRLLAPQGLEVAMQRRGFIKAQRELQFRSDRPSTLGIRLVGRPDTRSEIPLERRALRAVVQLAPALPIWPEDTIDAQVRLVDPSGRTDPAAIRPRIRVSVGQREVLTSWSHVGGVWKARIHGQPITGPQRLQVEVLDDQGLELGERYLELVADARPTTQGI